MPRHSSPSTSSSSREVLEPILPKNANKNLKNAQSQRKTPIKSAQEGHHRTDRRETQQVRGSRGAGDSRGKGGAPGADGRTRGNVTGDGRTGSTVNRFVPVSSEDWGSCICLWCHRAAALYVCK